MLAESFFVAFLGQTVQTLQVCSYFRWPLTRILYADDLTVVRFSFVTIRDEFTDAATPTTLHSCEQSSVGYSLV